MTIDKFHNRIVLAALIGFGFMALPIQDSGLGNQLESKITEEEPTQTDTVKFDKGRALAILIGIRKPGTDEPRNRYINSIFPIAAKYSYDPGVAFNVIEPSRGNYHPGFVAMASWPSLNHRRNFRKDPNLPKDMSQQRREIWSRFDQLLYDKLDERIEFSVREDKVYVFTAYWVRDKEAFKKYHATFLDKMKDHNGRLLLQLGSGLSPKNHLYDPDIFMISEWRDANTFRKHLQVVEALGLEDGTKNINEFITSYVFNF